MYIVGLRVTSRNLHDFPLFCVSPSLITFPLGGVPLWHIKYSFISFIQLACADCDDSLPFLGASSIPLCYIPFPSTLFLPTSLPSSLTSSCHLFLGYLSTLLRPDSYIILFGNSIFFHSLYMPKPV